MKQKKGMRIICGILLTVEIWLMLLILMFESVGVYSRSQESLIDSEMNSITYTASQEVLLDYALSNKEKAHERVKRSFQNCNMNFIILRNGEEYDRVVNSSGEVIWRSTALDAEELECLTLYVDEDGKDLSVDKDGIPYKQYSIMSEVTETVYVTDRIATVKHFISVFYETRIAVIAGFMILLIPLLLLLVQLIRQKVKEAEGVSERRKKRPLEVSLLGYGILIFTLAILADMSISHILYVLYEDGINIFGLWLFILAVICGIGAFVMMRLVLELAEIYATGGIWKATLLYRGRKRLASAVKGLFLFFRENIPFIWKGLLIFVGISLLELLILSAFWYEPDVVLWWWAAEKILLLAAVVLLLVQMRCLKESGEKLASGDLEHKTDTRHMFWEFKRHGENLNHISDGVAVAVEERIKSEHFKTELITNVSHDIKTPLTSIINYVDLLEKEELDNENAKEYLSILKRQSARLKKLIEDLMEASKASTGALAVHWEDCSVGVLLTQAAGEFEEKLNAQNLAMVLKQPEEEIMLYADGRHLWRIFDNLLNNIVKYAQPQTRVFLNLEQSNEDVRIIFRNTSKYELNLTGEELKERFVRGDSSRNTEGSGLGLSIAQSLTELMGGTFELVTDGDLFKVILVFPLKA